MRFIDKQQRIKISVEGGNTSLDEIETLKVRNIIERPRTIWSSQDIKKKLIKKTMLKKKRSSQDSEISLHRKMVGMKWEWEMKYLFSRRKKKKQKEENNEVNWDSWRILDYKWVNENE